jgi:hypothetical protein
MVFAPATSSPSLVLLLEDYLTRVSPEEFWVPYDNAFLGWDGGRKTVSVSFLFTK